MKTLIKIVCGIILGTMVWAGGSLVYFVINKHHIESHSNILDNQVSKIQPCTGVETNIKSVVENTIPPAVVQQNAPNMVQQVTPNIKSVVENNIPPTVVQQVTPTIIEQPKVEHSGVKKHHKYEGTVVPTK